MEEHQALVSTEADYTCLLEDLRATFCQTLKVSREAKMLCAHEVGQRLHVEFERTSPSYHRVLIRRISHDLSVDESELYRCIKFFEKFPVLESVYKLEDGENISWNKIKLFYLPELDGQPITEMQPKVEIDSFGLINWWKKNVSQKDYVFYVADTRCNIYLQIKSVPKEKLEVRRKPVKEKKEIATGSFEEIWSKYPDKIGRKSAERHFKATVKTDDDYKKITKALENYLKSKRVLEGYIQNGSTWFNQWQDWIDAPPDHVPGKIALPPRQPKKDCPMCGGTGRKFYGEGENQWIACGCLA